MSGMTFEEEAAAGEGAHIPAWARWTRRLGFAFVVAVALGLVALLAYGLANKGEAGAGPLRLNRAAPDFTLSLFDGGSFTLSENRGKPVVLNIWASWCEACRDEADELEQAWRDYRDEGVVFVGVNVLDNDADARKYIEEFGITYPNGPDEGSIYFDYGATGVPETFFINREGVIVLKYAGPLSTDSLSAFIEEVQR
ncbi:MAG: TlpA disulfide reductase family protein [Dehalococcoidia bacterium]|nr:TlpA disulfide reductase family protein [Dehalococcoidia bacterium]